MILTLPSVATTRRFKQGISSHTKIKTPIYSLRSIVSVLLDNSNAATKKRRQFQVLKFKNKNVKRTNEKIVRHKEHTSIVNERKRIQ